MAQYDTVLGFKIDFKALENLEKQLSDIQTQLKNVTKDVDNTAKETDKAGKSMSTSFNKVGAVIKSGLLVALAAAATGITLLFRNTINGQKEFAALESIVASTGGAAGYTAEQLNALAESLSRASTVSTGEINEAQARLLTYTDIVGTQYVEAMQLVVDWSARYGVSVTQAAETVGKALQKPSESAAALSRQGFKFTDEFIKKLKEMERAGNLAGAQMLLMNEQLKEGTEGAAEAARNTLGGAFDNLWNRIGDLVDGGPGSFSGLTEAINGFADLISSPQVKGAIDDLIKQFSDWTSEVFESASSLIGANGLAHALDAVGSTFSAIKNVIQAAVVAIVASIDGWVSAAKAAWAAMRGDFTEAGNLMDEARRKWALGDEMAAESISKAYGNVVDTLNSVKNAYNGVERAANASTVDMTPTNPRRATPTGDPDAAKKAARDAEREAKRLETAYNNLLGSMNERLVLSGRTTALAQTEYVTEHGNLKNLNKELKENLLNMAAKIDQMEVNSQIDAMNQELSILQAENALITGSIIPGTRAWAEAQAAVNVEIYRSRLEAQGYVGEDLEKLVNKYREVQNAQIENQEASKSWSSVMKENITDINALMQDNLINGLGGAFDALWDGSLKGFKQMLADMAKQLAKSMVLNFIMSFMGGGNYGTGMQGFSNRLMGTPMADGGAWNKGTQFFANGGIVNRATPFGMANGGLGVMGEAGPEAILPLARGSNGQLGVQVQGGGGTVINAPIQAGAIVVNATNDPGSDAEATAQAIKAMIDTRFQTLLKDSMRTGNMLNRTKSGIY